MTNSKRLEGAARIAVSNRNYRRARDRALVRLANAYPEQYKELLEREKLNDAIMGKKWTDLDGNTMPASDNANDSNESSGTTHYEREGESE